jgi:hypothetical protein
LPEDDPVIVIGLFLDESFWPTGELADTVFDVSRLWVDEMVDDLAVDEMIDDLAVDDFCPVHDEAWLAMTDVENVWKQRGQSEYELCLLIICDS